MVIPATLRNRGLLGMTQAIASLRNIPEFTRDFWLLVSRYWLGAVEALGVRA